MTKTWLTSLLAVLFAVAGAVPAKDNGTWKLDTVKLKSGRILQGLIEKEDEGSVYFRCVVQKPGSPTAVFHTIIPRTDIRENGIEPLQKKATNSLKVCFLAFRLLFSKEGALLFLRIEFPLPFLVAKKPRERAAPFLRRRLVLRQQSVDRHAERK